MATVGSLVVNLVLANAQFLRQMTQTANATGAATRNMQASMAKLSASFKTAAAGFGAFLVARGLKQAVVALADYSDAWKVATNQINAADAISNKQARSMEGIVAIAHSTRTSLLETTELYAKMLRSTDAVAKSEAEVARVTEIVARAFKAGGASMQEQVNGIRQLAQALASGVLQGDELRSLRENAPLLAQAIADEFRTTIGGLKKLGAEGQLTADRVFKAILKGAAPIDKAFAATSSTIAEAFTNLQTSITAYIGKIDQATGASKAFTGVINSLAKNFTAIADSLLFTKEIGLFIENIQLIMTNIDNLGKKIDSTAEGPLNKIIGSWESWDSQTLILSKTLSDLIGIDIEKWIKKSNDAIALPNPFTDLTKFLKDLNVWLKEVELSIGNVTVAIKKVDTRPLLFTIPKIQPDVSAFARTGEKFTAELDLRDQIQQMTMLSKAARQGRKDFDTLTDMLAAFNDALKVGNPLVAGMAQELMIAGFQARQLARLDDTRIALQEEQDNLSRSIGQQKLLALALSISAEEYNKLKIYIDAGNEAREKTIGLTQAETDALRAKIIQDKLEQQSLEKKAAAYNEVADTINSTVTSAISSVASAFADAIVEGENFRDTLDALLKDLAKLAINQVFQLFLKQMIGQVGGAGGTGTGLLGVTGLHSGGIVGNRVGGRSIPAAMFAGAPRLHGGGGAFFGGAEFPAILQRGEGVFTPEQMKALGGGTTNNFTVINQAPNTTTTEDRQQNASGGTDITVFIRQAMTKEISDPASSVHKSLKSNFGLSQAGVRR